MGKSETMLGDMCLAMGTIAEGCRMLGLISEEEYNLVNPKPTRYPYVRYLYHDEDEEPEKAPVSRRDSAAAYLTAPLVTLLDREITKHQSQLEAWDRNSPQPVPWWSPTFDEKTGKVVEDEAYALCVEAAAMFRELVEVMRKNGI